MKSLILSIRLLLTFMFLTGVAYPFLILGIGKLFFSSRSQGSLLQNENRIVGSEFIAQAFTSPKYFWPRPSTNKYDGTNSGGSNQSPTASDLIKVVQEREKAGYVQEMRFASASGLDPHISLKAAGAQLERISIARHLNADATKRLQDLMLQGVEPRQLGFLGEERINVLRLNLAIDKEFKE